MRVDLILERLGGVAEAGRLRQFTSRAKIRRAVRRGTILRDVRGRYALPGAAEALRAANRLAGVLSLDSAAQHWGWELKRQPETPSVTVPRNRKLPPSRRNGVRVRYADLTPNDVRGMATAPGVTVMDCASRLPFDEALTIADSALRHKDVSKRQLLELAERMPDRYRTRCLRVAQEADGRAANPFESVLRAIALDVEGLELVPQVVISQGGFVVRPDLVDVRLRLVVEADSFEWHGSRNARALQRVGAATLDRAPVHLGTRDVSPRVRRCGPARHRRMAAVRTCTRSGPRTVLRLNDRLHGRECTSDGLARRRWIVLRFTWEHVMFHPEYVAAVLRDIVGWQPFGRALEADLERLSA